MIADPVRFFPRMSRMHSCISARVLNMSRMPVVVEHYTHPHCMYMHVYILSNVYTRGKCIDIGI